MGFKSFSRLNIETYEEGEALVIEWMAAHPECTVYTPLIELCAGGGGYRVEFSYTY